MTTQSQYRRNRYLDWRRQRKTSLQDNTFRFPKAANSDNHLFQTFFAKIFFRLLAYQVKIQGFKLSVSYTVKECLFILLTLRFYISEYVS